MLDDRTEQFQESKGERRQRWIYGAISINVALSFVFGVVFLSVMLGFAVFFPNPPAFQLKVFITVLALAAAGVGAMMPGFLDIQYKGLFRTGGALALAAGVYLSSPAITQSASTLIEPKAEAEPVGLAFIHAVDAGNVEDSWNQLDPNAIGQSIDTIEHWKTIMTNYRKPLGRALTRQLVGTGTITSPPGYPIGIYRRLTYRTKFAGATSCRPEEVDLRATQDNQWRVFNYLIGPSGIDC
jgi:hypothetical protein